MLQGASEQQHPASCSPCSSGSSWQDQSGHLRATGNTAALPYPRFQVRFTPPAVSICTIHYTCTLVKVPLQYELAQTHCKNLCLPGRPHTGSQSPDQTHSLGIALQKELQPRTGLTPSQLASLHHIPCAGICMRIIC